MHNDDAEKTTTELSEELSLLREKLAAIEAAEKQDLRFALFKSQEQFKILFEGANVGIALTNFQGDLVQVNSTVAHMLGYSVEELRQMHFRDFTHPDDVAATLVLFNQLTEGTIPSYTMEKRYVRKDGYTLWVKLNVSLFPGEHEEKLVIAIAEDIGQRKRAEEHMLREKQFIDTVIDTLPGLFYLFDDQGNFLRWNKNVESITGYTAHELATMHPDQFFPKAVLRDVQNVIEQVFEQGEAAVESRLVSNDGTRLPYLFTGKPIIFEGMRCVVGMGIELTERKRMEQALRRSEEAARQFEARLRVLQRVMNQLAATETFDEMCRLAVQLGHSLLGFDRMSLWFIDPKDSAYKVGAFGMNELGEISDQRDQRLLIDVETPSLENPDGENTVVVREDVALGTPRSEFIRFGWNVIALIWDGHQGIGWLTADNILEQKPLTSQDVEILRLFALALGPLCTRKRAEDALRQSEESARLFQDQLRNLHHVVNELARTETFDDLCRTAIELGRQYLGFERLGLWFIDPDQPNYQVGSFGIDEQGNLRDERHQRIRTSDGGDILGFLKGETLLIRNEGPIYNDQSEVIGVGQSIISVVWDGTKNIGWISADNYLTHQPFLPHQIETMRLFGLALGPLCKRRQAEDTLRQREESARDFQELLRKLHYVVNELARTETFDDLCRSAVELGRKYLGFDRLGLWFVAPDDPEYQVGSFGTDEAGNLRDERSQRLKSETAGTPIRMFTDGESVIIRDGDKIYDDSGNVVGIGWTVVTLVWDGTTGIGWLSVDNFLNKQPLLPYQVEVIRLFGLALGPLCKRRQAEDTLRQREESARRFQELLRQLHYVVNELAKVDTFDDLCRRAIELGRSRLGFDRLSLWFIDPAQPDSQIGSFGTDETGNIRDERGKRVGINEDTIAMLELSDENALYVRHEGAHYDDIGNIVGEGWTIAALLWDGDKGIGWLNADNYLGHSPLQQQQKEILQLYGLALGPLCKRRQAEDALRQREESARYFQEQLRLLHLVVNELTKAETFDELCYQTVRLGREKLGFDRMSLWFIDPENPAETVGSYGTDEEGSIRDERTLRRVVQPHWDKHLSEEEFLHIRHNAPIFNHRSQPVGFGWAIAAVMWDGNKVVGWLNADNFFSHVELNSHHKEILKLFGLALGPLCTRKRAEDALRRSEEAARSFQEQLRNLQIVVNELARAESFNDLCYQAIRLGRVHLGFDRMSLWFVAPDNPNEMVGAYGTDEHGNIRDERGQRLAVNQALVEFFEMSHNKNVYIRTQSELYNEKGEIVGDGWLISALLLDGNQNIGWISADNYLNKQPLLPQHQEIMRLFGLALGPLCTRKRAEQALQKSEESWRSLVQNAPDTIMEVDTNYCIRFVNRLSPGVLPEQVIGKRADEFALPEHRSLINKTFEHVFKTGESSSYEVVARITSRGERWHSTRVSPIIHDGKVVALTLISSDITEIKEAERQKVELELEREKMRILTHFITDASHEFRTPLSIINSSLYLLMRTQDPARKIHHQAQIENQVENITLLLEDLITMTRLDSDTRLSFRRINLNEVAFSSPHSLMLTLQEKGLQLVFELSEKPLFFQGAVAEIHQAIINLIDNAIRNTPAGGLITVRTYTLNQEVVIEIEDNGTGIPETELSLIFDRFYRIDKSHSTRGFGLGLSITRKIVELHQGKIEVESHLSQGSIFRLRFPAEVVSEEAFR